MDAVASLDAAYPALILKANRGVIHHGAVGIARTLGRSGVPVYAIVDESYTPLAASRYLTKTFIWKDWPADHEAFRKAMSAIGALIGRPTVLFPIDDLSAAMVAENAAALSPWFLAPRSPTNIARQLADKAYFYSLCARIGVPVARSIVPHKADDIRDFVESVGFPIVVKAATQWSLISGKYSTAIAHNHDQLARLCQDFRPGVVATIILQEYVIGEDWVYHGYCNSEKGLYLSFAGKKLLSYPLNAGSTVLGRSLGNAALCGLAERLLKAISYSGIVDMDWRRDARDGQYKIMDCNPRVGQNFRMFENDAAIDVVRAQHLDLTGRNVDDHEMTEERLFTVEPFYVLALIRGGRHGETSSASKRAPRGHRELAWWCGDDPLPALMMLARLLLQYTQRALSQFNSRRADLADRGASFQG